MITYKLTNQSIRLNHNILIHLVHHLLIPHLIWPNQKIMTEYVLAMVQIEYSIKSI